MRPTKQPRLGNKQKDIARCLFAVLAALWAATAANSQTRDSGNLEYDFRDRPPPDEMKSSGIPEGQSRVDAGGLRITLPSEQVGGIDHYLAFPIKLTGDFELTTTIEILSAKEPPAELRAYGVGVLLAIEGVCRIGRVSRSDGWQGIIWDRVARVDGERTTLRGARRCEANAMKFRLKRTSKTLHCLWADATDGESFHEFYQFECGDADMKNVRYWFNCRAGAPNDNSPALDMRIVDLRISSDTVGLVSAVGAPSSPQRAQVVKSRKLTAILVGSGIIVLAVCTWFLLKRRQRTAATQSEQVVEKT
jgi:hypothetical protein